jgi:hypothetical protein
MTHQLYGKARRRRPYDSADTPCERKGCVAGDQGVATEALAKLDERHGLDPERGAAPEEYKIARRAPSTRRASAGMKGADTTKLNGVIAADKPITIGAVPCRSNMKLSSGSVAPAPRRTR